LTCISLGKNSFVAMVADDRMPCLVLDGLVLYCIVLYCIVLYCIVLLIVDCLLMMLLQHFLQRLRFYVKDQKSN
jgi:hypothetical protein